MAEIDLSTMGAAAEAAPEPELRPAKINDRFLAYLLDTLPFFVGYHYTLSAVPARMPEWAANPAFPTAAAGAWAALYWLYQTAGNLAGGTIGKKLMGLAVVTRAGEPLGAIRSAVRGFGSILSSPANLGYILALFHPESRALHDLLAGSLVVESRRKSPGEAWLLFLLATGSVIGMFAGTFYLRRISPSAGDIRRIVRARAALAELGRVQESYKAAHGTYTDSLDLLSQASGDPEAFAAFIEDNFDPQFFELKAGDIRYRITAAARDRGRTRVVLEGP